MCQELLLSRTTCCFLLKIAQLHYRKQDFKSADEYFSQLKEQGELDKRVKAEANESIGDLMLRQGNLDEANKKYIGADESLNKLMDRSYILDIVNVFAKSRVDLTPGEKKVVSRFTNPTTARRTAASKRKSPLEEEAEKEECVPLQRSQVRIQFKQGQVALERGCLEDSQAMLLHALSKFDQLEDPVRGSAHNIDKIAILYHLGRLSVSKSLSNSGSIIDTLWSDPESLIDDLEEARDAIKAEEVLTKPKKTRRKCTIEDECDSSVYHLEKARSYLTQALEYCLVITCPTMMRDVCQELARITGALNPQRTAAYLSLALGNSSLHLCLTNTKRRMEELKKKLVNHTDDLEDLDDLEELDPEHFDLEDLTTNLSKIRISSSEEDIAEATEEAAENPNEMKERLVELNQRFSLLCDLRKQLFTHVDDFQQKFVSDLPPEWTTCVLNVTPGCDTLLITRLRATAPPVTVRIPLQVTKTVQRVRGGTRTETKYKYKEIYEAFKEILQDNKGHLRASRSEPEKVKNEDWWTKRTKLDLAMGKIVERLETEIFGTWRCLLLGSFASPAIQDELEKNFEELVESVEDAADVELSATSRELLFSCFSGVSSLTPGSVRNCLQYIFGWSEADKGRLKILATCGDIVSSAHDAVFKKV
jgi:tetratricopeptide (TPR) repeat protein